MKHQRRDDLQEYIDKYSEKYDIPQGLVKAIIEVESGGNTYAMRYEDHYRWLVKPFSQFHWHDGTEKQGQKTSWGLMQIMGAVARERGFKGRYLSALTNPEIGIEYGCKHLKWQYDRYSDWQDAISAFNQGSNRKTSQGRYQNQDYVDMVVRKWKSFKTG